MNTVKKLFANLSLLSLGALGMAGTYQVVQITPYPFVSPRSGDAYGLNGDVVFYEPSYLSRSVRPPQFPSSSDTRQAVAETIFKIKFIPAYPGELPPTTALAHIKVKRNLKTVVGYPGPTSGGGSAQWEAYSLYKSIGPNVMMTMNIPASSTTGYLRTDQTGDPFQAPVNTLEYLPFGFVQDSNGDWYGTQAYAVAFDMKASVSSSAMYTIAGASAYARVDFKIVQIDNQVIDPNF